MITLLIQVSVVLVIDFSLFVHFLVPIWADVIWLPLQAARGDDETPARPRAGTTTEPSFFGPESGLSKLFKNVGSPAGTEFQNGPPPLDTAVRKGASVTGGGAHGAVPHPGRSKTPIIMPFGFAPAQGVQQVEALSSFLQVRK